MGGGQLRGSNILIRALLVTNKGALESSRRAGHDAPLVSKFRDFPAEIWRFECGRCPEGTCQIGCHAHFVPLAGFLLKGQAWHTLCMPPLPLPTPSPLPLQACRASGLKERARGASGMGVGGAQFSHKLPAPPPPPPNGSPTTSSGCPLKP